MTNNASTPNGVDPRGTCPGSDLREAAELWDGEGVQREQIADAVRAILAAVGDEPARDGLQRTPERVAKMYDELLQGYRTDPYDMLNDAVFDVQYDEMVIVRDIEYSSLCEHHMLPFLGRAHVAYLPRHKVIGLSKIPRIVDLFARRLQVQERMTTQIAQFLQQAIDPLGVGVVCEGIHLCSMIRGVRKANSKMITSALLGEFRDNASTRSEFMNHISRGSGPMVSI